MVTAKRSKPSLFCYANRVALAAALGLGLAACDGLVEGDLNQSAVCAQDNSGNQNCSGAEGPQFDAVNSPVGTVTGLAQDTNGNPLAGATVTVGGMPSVTTDSAGQFRIPNVAVTGTVGNIGGAPGAATIPAIPVTIQLDGYAGATLQVRPMAQVSSSNLAGGDNQGIIFVDGFTATVGNVILPRIGTNATGVLRDRNTGTPIGNQVLNFDFVGVSLDQANAVASGVVFGYQDSNTIQTVTTAADGSFTITNLVADGCYDLQATGLNLTAQNAPPSVCGVVNGAAPAAPGGTVRFRTQNEGTQTAFIGEVLGNAISTADLTNVFVTQVANVLDGTVTPGQLAQGVNQSFLITLSEPTTLAPGAVLSQNDIVVLTGTALNPALQPSTATVVDNRTIRVDLATALPNGQAFSIDLRIDQFIDLAGNVLGLNNQNVANAQGGMVINAGAANVVPPVAYDAVGAVGYIRLNLMTFNPLDTNTNGGALAQVTTPVNPASDNAFKVTSALSDFVINDAALPSFLAAGRMLRTQANAQVALVSNGYEQLNSIDPRVDPASAFPAALQRLLDILSNGSLTAAGSPNAVHARTATADLTLGTANHYLLWVTDPTGNVQNVNAGVYAVNDSSNPRIVGTLRQFNAANTVPAKTYAAALAQQPGCNAANAGTCAIYVVSKGGATSALAVIQDAGNNLLRPGLTLNMVSRSGSGFTGTLVSVPLRDTVAPTVGAQFFAGTAGAIQSVNSSSAASGGTTINLATAEGQVIYPVTPQAFEMTDNNNVAVTGLSGDTFRDANEPQALSNAAVRGAGMQATVGVTANMTAIADATGMAAFLAAPTRGLGLVVTEATSVVPNAAAVSSAGSTAMVTGFQAINNAVDELTAPVHLLAFSTNVLQLEDDGRAKRTIDFSPVFTDRASTPNQAMGKPVSIRDFTPPMMTKAFYDGTIFSFSFHEGIAGGDGTAAADITIECGAVDVGIDIDAVTANASVQYTTDRKRLTVPQTVTVGGAVQNNPAIAAPLSIGSSCFPESAAANAAAGSNPKYSETAYTLANVQADGSQLSTVAAQPIHAVVFYGRVRDQSNNMDLGVGQVGNDWAYWAGQNLGIGFGAAGSVVSGPAFSLANVIPPFGATIQCFNFVAPGAAAPATAPGKAGQQFSCDVNFSGPVWLSDLMANGAGAAPNDINGQDADDGASGGMGGGTANDGIVSQGELTAYMAGKFVTETAAGVAKATLQSATMKRVSGGVASATFVNNGTVLTLTFLIGGADLATGDRVRLDAGGAIGTPPLVAGETTSLAISGAISPLTQFIIHDDGAGVKTARELSPVIIP